MVCSEKLSKRHQLQLIQNAAAKAGTGQYKHDHMEDYIYGNSTAFILKRRLYLSLHFWRINLLLNRPWLCTGHVFVQSVWTLLTFFFLTQHPILCKDLSVLLNPQFTTFYHHQLKCVIPWIWFKSVKRHTWFNLSEFDSEKPYLIPRM